MSAWLGSLSSWAPVYQQQQRQQESVEHEKDWIQQYALSATLAFALTVYVWETYLDFRQRTALQSTTFPAALAKTVGSIDAGSKKREEKALLPQLQEKFAKAQSYGLDKIHFGMISSVYDIAESVVFLLAGFMPYMWDWSVQTGADKFGWTEEENELRIAWIFLGATTVLGTITSLPFEVYSTFVIEKKHNFNKMTPALFVTDKIKSLALTAVIGAPVVWLLLFIIQKGGPHFYLYAWAFMFTFSVFMMTVYPVVIMPLFNKFDQMAEKVKYPLTNLFVMDGSTRSAHSNAFMFGFGNNKRIVLFDTLLDQVTDNEVLAILGHELGHWKLGHTLSNFVITQLYTGAAFGAFAQTTGSTSLYAAFGFHRPVPALIALTLFFQTFWAPIDKLLSFLLTVKTRICEFQADKFSVDMDMSSDLQSGLCKIHLENLGAMNPDRLYSTYHYSHPPLVERLSAMMDMDRKKA